MAVGTSGMRFLPPSGDGGGEQPEVTREAVAQDRAAAKQSTAGAGMDRRSWYMPADAANALAELVEELHWRTRQPKHAVLAAAVDLLTAQQDRLEKKLTTKSKR